MKRLFTLLIIVTVASLTTVTAQTVAQMNEWSQRAQEAEDDKQYAEAISNYELYLEGYAKNYSQEDDTYALVLFKLARCYYNTGNYLKAAEYGEKEAAVTLALYGKNDEEFATSMQNLGVYYARLGDNTKALDCGHASAEAYKAAVGEQHPKYAQALSNLARFHSEVGNYSDAVRQETMAMQIFKAASGNDNESYLTSLNNLSVYYSQLGDAAKALEYGMMAQEQYLSEGQTDNAEYAMTLDHLANYHASAGDYSKASELCLQALRILRNTVGTAHPDYATVLSDLANTTSLLGNQRRAIEMGTRALTIRQDALGQDHPLCAQSLSNLSHYFSALGDNDKAVEYGEQALAIWQREANGMNTDYAACLSNLSNYYSALGNTDKAVEMCVQAAEIRKAVLGATHPDYALSLNNLASLLFRHGEYERAKETGSRAMMTSRTSLGEHHPNYATALSNLAGYHAMLGHYDESLDFFSQSISISYDNVLQQFAGLTAKRRTLFWNNISDDFTVVYPTYVFRSQATTAPDLYDKAALFAKGLLLSTEIEMNRLIQESGDKEAVKMFENLQLNRLQLQRLYETPVTQRQVNTDSLARAINRMERDLIRRSKVYGDFTMKLRSSWKDVQGALKNDEIAVEFLSFNIYGTDSTMVVALTLRKDDKEPKFIPLFEQRQLQGVSDPVYYHCPELTQLVWQPLQQELKGIHRIYFSPAGALHNIGIEYAPGMEEYEMYRLTSTREIETSPSPSQGGEKGAVLYGGVDYNASLASSPPSGGMEEVSEEALNVSYDLHRALIDSLDVRGFSAKYLPGTLSEVEAIKQSLDRQHQPAVMHTGKDATETSVKEESGHAPRLLHLATHGFYFTAQQAKGQNKLRFLGQHNAQGNARLATFSLGGGQGEASLSEDKALTRSGLLFAGANNALEGQTMPMDADDGILTAQEISRLDLRGLDLVVLSACKTGQGDINQGEGVFGLQRGFKKAGAKTIVMSLWEVADEATQILMTTFYDHLLSGQSKREAFRGAQRYLRAIDNGRFDHPEFWAAFVLLD